MDETGRKIRLHFLAYLRFNPGFSLIQRSQPRTDPKSEVTHCLVCMFRAVTMHDRPAKMFADLDIAGQHELFHRLDIFQYVLFMLIKEHACIGLL